MPPNKRIWRGLRETARMDHADINTTMRYVHATEQGKRRAVEAAAKGRNRIR